MLQSTLSAHLFKTNKIPESGEETQVHTIHPTQDFTDLYHIDSQHVLIISICFHMASPQPLSDFLVALFQTSRSVKIFLGAVKFCGVPKVQPDGGQWLQS